MIDLCFKRYNNLGKSLAEIGPYLQEHEVQNSFILTEMNKDHPEGIFVALLNKETNGFIFGLLATKEFVYVSKLSTPSNDKEYHQHLIDHLVCDFLSTSFCFEGIQGYDPELTMVLAAVRKHSELKFNLRDDVWSYIIEKVEWSSRSLEIKNDPHTLLYWATLNDLEWVTEWTQDFLDDDAGKIVVEPNLKELCREEIEGNNVCILFVGGSPVSMARKRRPLRDGCALSMVYTPVEHRRKGYGGACVSMVTDVLLKSFKYVTLFVDAKQNPLNNMYTGVGYRMLTKAGRCHID